MKAEKVKIIQSILVEKVKWGQQQLLPQLPCVFMKGNLWPKPPECPSIWTWNAGIKSPLSLYWPCCEACTGIEPGPQQWKRPGLTTGLPRSLLLSWWQSYCFTGSGGRLWHAGLIIPAPLRAPCGWSALPGPLVYAQQRSRAGATESTARGECGRCGGCGEAGAEGCVAHDLLVRLDPGVSALRGGSSQPQLQPQLLISEWTRALEWTPSGHLFSPRAQAAPNTRWQVKCWDRKMGLSWGYKGQATDSWGTACSQRCLHLSIVPLRLQPGRWARWNWLFGTTVKNASWLASFTVAGETPSVHPPGSTCPPHLGWPCHLLPPVTGPFDKMDGIPPIPTCHCCYCQIRTGAPRGRLHRRRGP